MQRTKPWWLLSITLLSIVVFLVLIYSPSRESYINSVPKDDEKTKQVATSTPADTKQKTDETSETNSKTDTDTTTNTVDEDKIKVQSNEQPKDEPDRSDSEQPVVPIGNTMTLFGMSIGDDKRTFLAKHGSPMNEYFTDGDLEPLLVLEFADFIAGFDSNGRAEFINVTSSGIDVGLGGVAIGSSIDDVSHVMGEATSFSSYVITYTQNNNTLKFDIDPAMQTVTSIKLFKQAE
jgi:hypothetical protein